MNKNTKEIYSEFAETALAIEAEVEAEIELSENLSREVIGYLEFFGLYKELLGLGRSA